MTSSEDSNVLNVLWKRSHFLRKLEEQEFRRPELVEEVSETRSTVYRGLEQLERIGAVEIEANECRVTPFGSLLLEEYERTTRVVDGLLDARPLLTESTHPFCDAEFVSRGSVFCASSRDPDRPRRVLRNALEDATDLSLAVPCVLSSCFRWITDTHERTGTSVTAVIDRDVFPVVEENYPEFVGTLETDDSHLWVVEASLDCPIVVVERPDPAVFLISVNSRGNFQGLIRNTRSESVERALDWIEGFYEGARLYA